MNLRAALLVPAAVLLSWSSALAQSYPDEYARRPLQLPWGMAQLKVPVVFNVSEGADGKPITVPFDIRLGISNDLELRLFHPRAGVCISGCDEVYDDIGFGMLLSVAREQGIEMSVLGALEVLSFSGSTPMRLDAGFAFKALRGPFSVAAWPYVGIALNDRANNADSINIPIELAYQLAYPTALFIETGFYAAVDAPENGTGPIGVGINHLLKRGVDIGAELKLNRILGDGDTDSRVILVYAAIRNQ